MCRPGCYWGPLSLYVPGITWPARDDPAPAPAPARPSARPSCPCGAGTAPPPAPRSPSPPARPRPSRRHPAALSLSSPKTTALRAIEAPRFSAVVSPLGAERNDHGPVELQPRRRRAESFPPLVLLGNPISARTYEEKGSDASHQDR